MANQHNDTTLLLEGNIHRTKRSILITDLIDEQTTTYVWRAVQLLDYPNSEIKVFVNTVGGDIYEGLAIYDMLKGCQATVSVIGLGKVMSCGSQMVLQAADEGHRYLTPNATVLVHTGGANQPAYEKFQDFRISYEETMRSFDHFHAITAQRMGITLKQFYQRFEKDKFYTAEKAIELGIADDIWS